MPSLTHGAYLFLRVLSIEGGFFGVIAEVGNRSFQHGS
jgi:hypothetical protein